MIRAGLAAKDARKVCPALLQDLLELPEAMSGEFFRFPLHVLPVFGEELHL
jgi:hypothetical protein